MDSLTQIVLGAAVGEAVLGRKIGTRAMLWGAIAGTIPDLDVFTRLFTDSITAGVLHRGFSHSLLFCLIASPILAWIAHKIHKKRNADYRGWVILFFMCLVTHPLLDMHTDYGTQFLWPFDLRIAYKNIFVVDPIYTIPFLICCIVALCYKKERSARRKWNNAGLIISSTYMLLTLIFKGVGLSHFSDSLAEQNIDYVELDSRPTPFNSILWNAQIETDNGFRVGYYSLLNKTDSIQFSQEFPKNRQLIEPFLEEDKVQKLVLMSQGWYFNYMENDTVVFADMRFGQIGFDVNESPFAIRHKLYYDESGEFQAQPVRFERGDIMAKMFQDLVRKVEGE